MRGGGANENILNETDVPKIQQLPLKYFYLQFVIVAQWHCFQYSEIDCIILKNNIFCSQIWSLLLSSILRQWF